MKMPSPCFFRVPRGVPRPAEIQTLVRDREKRERKKKKGEGGRGGDKKRGKSRGRVGECPGFLSCLSLVSPGDLSAYLDD